ncbi:MAG: carbohydrate kinase [Thalassobius sp.]|nr:carbohydrate kinase [Thalassovita sp.]
MEKAIAIFDIGKTNKKFLVFNDEFEILHEESIHVPETVDDDGFSCDNIEVITQWVYDTFNKNYQNDKYQITKLNFASYGASFVYLDENGKPCTPLYNYLKPMPEALLQQFYDTYGGKIDVCRKTASPSLGMLNSGLQVYWLKHTKPEKFKKVKYALHLPQYFSYLFSKKPFAEITSIGCHTFLWNYENDSYHQWVEDESISLKFPDITRSDLTLPAADYPGLQVGAGLHDSSASLIPYLQGVMEPFALISTGTWSIVLNPFSKDPLTEEMLERDCLNFLTYKGKTVRASRLFLGHVHDTLSRKIEKHFNAGVYQIHQIEPDIELISAFLNGNYRYDKYTINTEGKLTPDFPFEEYKDLSTAYHHLFFVLITLQCQSIKLAIGSSKINKLIISGGFAKSTLYKRLLASLLPSYEIYIAELKESTASGAAMAITSNIDEVAIQKICNLEHVIPFVKAEV